MRTLLVTAALLALTANAAGARGFALSSPSFRAGGPIPRRFT